MPKFKTEVNVDEWFDADVDLSVEEFVDECSDSEIKELITYLKDMDYLSSDMTGTGVVDKSINEIEYETMVTKLHGRYHSLTDEEYEGLKKLTSRF